MPELTPPDFGCCQAEITDAHNPFGIGAPPPSPRRCTARPQYLLTEKEPGEDGQRGSMTLCESCLEQFRQRMPADYAEVKALSEIPIRLEDGTTWPRVGDLEWTLRYGEPSKEQLLTAAWIVASYGALIDPGHSSAERQLKEIRTQVGNPADSSGGWLIGGS